MKKLRDILVGLFDIIFKILFEYSKYVLIAIVAIVSAQVVARNLFKGSIMWSQEVSLLLIVWMTFLSMAIGSEKNLHIGGELFYSFFPKPIQKLCDGINNVIVLIIGAFLGIYGTRLVISTMSSTLAATKWPAGVLYLMIPVGGWCMFFFKMLDCFGWKKYKKTDLDEKPEAAEEEETV